MGVSIPYCSLDTIYLVVVVSDLSSDLCLARSINNCTIFVPFFSISIFLVDGNGSKSRLLFSENSGNTDDEMI